VKYRKRETGSRDSGFNQGLLDRTPLIKVQECAYRGDRQRKRSQGGPTNPIEEEEVSRERNIGFPGCTMEANTGFLKRRNLYCLVTYGDAEGEGGRLRKSCNPSRSTSIIEEQIIRWDCGGRARPRLPKKDHSG